MTKTTIPYEFTVMPAEDITLYAKWEPNQVTVTFVYLDGRANTVVTGSVGSQLEEISPTRDGYSFEGWYKDNQFTDKFTDFTFPVTSIHLYALWEPLDYTIEFVTGIEGVEVDPITAPYNSWVDLPVPVAEGFKFLGWYTDPETTVLFEEHWMPLGGITLYAKWTESAEEFSIAYALEQEPGTLVSVKGIVFAKVQSPYGDSISKTPITKFSALRNKKSSISAMNYSLPVISIVGTMRRFYSALPMGKYYPVIIRLRRRSK